MEYYTVMKVNKILVQIMLKNFRDVRYQVKTDTGSSMVVQWLGLHWLSLARAWVQSPVGELKSYKLCSTAKNIKKKNTKTVSCMFQLA